jgi:hypothetical protein
MDNCHNTISLFVYCPAVIATLYRGYPLVAAIVDYLTAMNRFVDCRAVVGRIASTSRLPHLFVDCPAVIAPIFGLTARQKSVTFPMDNRYPRIESQ